MLRDLRLLLWLRVRHARTFLVRLAHFAGSDPSVERDVSDRVYQLYAAAAALVFVALMWFALLDAVEGAFAAAGSSLAPAAVSGVLLAGVAVFAFLAVRAVRSAPLRLSRPAIAYVAASPIALRALVADAAGASVLATAVGGGLGGFLLGAGLAALGAAAAPAAAAPACAALLAATAGGAWVAGLARLAVRGRRRRAATILSAVAVAALCALGAAGALVLGPGLAAAGAPGFAALGSAALAAVGLEAAALAALAPRADMVAVVEESALAADLDPFGPFSPLDIDVQRDYRRRVKIARRGPRFRLPAASGRGALVARAALSLVRQREGLPVLATLGAGVTPLGVMALFGVGAPVTLLFWLMMLVLMQPSPAREASRAFRDDVRVRLVRDRLPFGVLELLVLDSLPAFVLVTALTCAVVPFVLPAGAPLGAALALGVFANAATLLCAGLEAVRLFPGGPRPWSEGGLIALVSATAALSAVGHPWLVVAAAAAVCAAVALVVRNGVERAR